MTQTTANRRRAYLLGRKRKDDKREAEDRATLNKCCDHVIAIQLGYPSDWQSRFVQLSVPQLQALLRLAL